MLALEIASVVPPPAYRVPRQAWRNGSASIGERTLAEEVPVAFSYDGATHAVLMATPDDLKDFAFGFSYTEGIITTPKEISELNVVSVSDGIVLRMWLTGDRSDAFAARRRRFVGPAGCGMCGLESLAEANRTIPKANNKFQVSRRDIAEAVTAMSAMQLLNMQTRAVHAAGFWRPGQSLVLREDVGRHQPCRNVHGGPQVEAFWRSGLALVEAVAGLDAVAGEPLQVRVGSLPGSS
jgi:FdhD protein